MQLEKIRW